jgi:hypothetical protein
MNLPISISDRLITQHHSLETIIAGLGEKHILNHPIPDKWSIKDNIAHLARYQLVYLNRLNIILTRDTPVFDAYLAETDNEFEKWLRISLDQLLEEIYADRKIIIDQLDNLTKNELERVGIHSKFGKLTVLDWTEFFLLHEAHHLFTIFRLAHLPV